MRQIPNVIKDSRDNFKRASHDVIHSHDYFRNILFFFGIQLLSIDG